MKNDFERFFQDQDYLELKDTVFWFLNSRKAVQCSMRKLGIKGTVMEVGSGTAPKSLFPERTIFTDLSQEALRQLQGNGLEGFVQDVAGMAVRDGSVQAIVCSEVLEHVPDYKKALGQLHSALERDGSLIITVPLHKHYFWRDDEMVGHCRRFNPRELKRDLEKAGFENVKVKKIGGLGERLGIHLMVRAFGRKKQGKSPVPRGLWKAGNKALSVVMRVFGRVTPLGLSNSALFYCTAKKE